MARHWTSYLVAYSGSLVPMRIVFTQSWRPPTSHDPEKACTISVKEVVLRTPSSHPYLKYDGSLRIRIQPQERLIMLLISTAL